MATVMVRTKGSSGYRQPATGAFSIAKSQHACDHTNASTVTDHPPRPGSGTFHSIHATSRHQTIVINNRIIIVIILTINISSDSEDLPRLRATSSHEVLACSRSLSESGPPQHHHQQQHHHHHHPSSSCPSSCTALSCGRRALHSLQEHGGTCRFNAPHHFIHASTARPILSCF
jgi:hypothetical protein